MLYLTPHLSPLSELKDVTVGVSFEFVFVFFSVSGLFQFFKEFFRSSKHKVIDDWKKRCEIGNMIQIVSKQFQVFSWVVV